MTPQRVVLPAILSVLCLGWPGPMSAQTPITIIHVNDTHSHLDAFGPRDASLQGTLGGIARAATLIGAMKTTDPSALFVHGGDAFHGDVFFNVMFDVPELKILKQLGIDAMAVGNHEFDFTPTALVGALSQVGAFPMTSANLDFGGCVAPEPCRLLPNWIKPGIVKTVGDVRVGFFGLTTPDDKTMQPHPVKVLASLVDVATAEVGALRAQGADVVVLLSHLGRPADVRLLAEVAGIDVVIGAHDHLADAAPFWFDAPEGRKVPGVSAGEHYLFVGRLRLVYTPGQGVAVDDWALVPVDTSVPTDPEVAAVVAGAQAAITQACQEDFWGSQVGYAPYAIPRTYDPEKQRRDTAMGNLVTDSLRGFTGTDLGLSVTGLIGEGLYPGPIVADDLYRPITYGYTAGTCYGFRLATFEIQGAELVKAIETSLQLGSLTRSSTYDPQVSGLRYRYDSSLPPGQRVILDSIHVNGRPFDPTETYTVTTNEGIAMLLPGMGVTIGEVRVVDGAFEYAVLRDYVRAFGTVDTTSEARIRDVAALPSAQR